MGIERVNQRSSDNAAAESPTKAIARLFVQAGNPTAASYSFGSVVARNPSWAPTDRST